MLGRGPQQGLYRPRGLGFKFRVEFRVVASQQLQQSTDQCAARRPGGGAPSASLLCSQDPSDGWDCLSAYYASFRVPKAVVRFAQGPILRNLGPTSTCTTLVLGPFATKVLGQLDELLHKFQGPNSSTEVCAKLGQAVSIPVLALLDKSMDIDDLGRKFYSPKSSNQVCAKLWAIFDYCCRSTAGQNGGLKMALPKGSKYRQYNVY